jgi:hypothetical protein
MIQKEETHPSTKPKVFTLDIVTKLFKFTDGILPTFEEIVMSQDSAFTK